MNYYRISYTRSDMPNPLSLGKYAKDEKHACKLAFGKAPDKNGFLLYYRVVKVNILSIVKVDEVAHTR